MPNAQNGWPVIPDTAAGRSKLTNLVLPGGPMDHPVLVLDGDVATIAEWHVREYHRRVERIESAGCWGWNVRKIGKTNVWSCHAAACAWDLNAPDNPDGVPTKKVMTGRQIDECHELENESDGVLRWGGDWSDPDAMHWEIVGTPAEAAALARKIRNEEGLDMDENRLRAILREEISKETNQVAGEVWTHQVALPDGRTVSYGTILKWLDASTDHTRDLAGDDAVETRRVILEKLAELAELMPDEPPTTPATA